MTTRIEFSKRVRAEAYLRCGGNCESCGMKLKPGEVEYDHRIAFYLSQDSSLENAQCLCRACHRGVGAKTADDQKIIAKVKRLQLKNSGAWPETRSKIKSRGFARTRGEA